MRIVLEFNYLPEDLKDFGKLWWKTRRKPSPTAFRRGIIGWILFIPIAAALFLLMGRQVPSVSTPAPTPPVTPTAGTVMIGRRSPGASLPQPPPQENLLMAIL